MFLSGLWITTGGLVHATWGWRDIGRPIDRSALEPPITATNSAVWHMLTVHLIALGGYLSYLGFLGRAPAPATAQMVLLQLLGYTVIFLAIGLNRFRSVWVLPQWTLTLPAALVLLNAWPHFTAIGAGLITAALLATLGGLHVYWAWGGTWPARGRRALSEFVVGSKEDAPMPPRAATLTVAAGLFGMAVILTGLTWLSGEAPQWYAHLGVAIIALFTIRGLGGFLDPWIRPSIRGTPYEQLNRAVYSPLCLGIACLATLAIYP